MLLPLFNHQTSVPHRTHPNPATPPIPSFFFPSPLPRTLFSQNPGTLPKFLLRPLAAAADTQTLPQTAIKRIAEKLRSLGYVEDTKEESKETINPNSKNGSPGEIFIPLPKELPKHRVGHTLDPSWSTPENPVPVPGMGNSIQRFHELRTEVYEAKQNEKEKEKGQKREQVPTLAELTLSKAELRRLRAMGIKLKKKLKVGKAGITEGIVNGIHERWRTSELVRIACEDICRMNMKRTHDLLERKTGGLVIWRSGSNLILYRGTNYKYPYFFTDNDSKYDTPAAAPAPSSSADDGVFFGENCSNFRNGMNTAVQISSNKMRQPPLIQGVGSPKRVRFQLPGEAQLAEEADQILDGLGPRFTDWWGFDPVPVDADLLPATVAGYRKPFRLLPYGVNPKLTNDEMTTLKRLGRPLPCHFALGRNRKLQGLAASMVKLWEKCEIAKIAVKRGVQNTNSELMAEELKWLTGGILLSRDKEFIVFYRGKDFLPAAVSSAIEERRKCGIPMEKQRTIYGSSEMITQESTHEMVDSRGEDICNDTEEQDGILIFQNRNLRSTQVAVKRTRSEDICNDTKDQEGILVSQNRNLRSTEAAVKRTNKKLQMALEKKARAEKLLNDLEKEEIPQEAEIDKEGITEEERYMLRKVGLRMKPFLLLGRRGVFDGTVENMHLHWKYRELVKVVCGGRSTEEVHGVAQTLETESGGILVAVERVSKGYAIIVYRGKNYTRPSCLRPRTLLNKREALKRSLEAQRRQSLKLHVLKLSNDIDELKLQLVKDQETNCIQSAKESNFQLATEQSGANSSFFNSNDGIDASRGSSETSQQDMLRSFSSIGEDQKDELKLTEAEPLSESELEKTSALMGINGQGQDPETITCPDDHKSQDQASSMPAVNAKPHVHNMDKIPSIYSPKNEREISFQHAVENTFSDVPLRAARLSNRDRLLLRKQALKMRKRPVLAVGRSNIVSGVAKAIKAHFQKHPLAIVNVKGRAKGTSVQEVVFKLEQATGAVLVSQEPNKVILYRGWGAEQELGRTIGEKKEDMGKASVGREGTLRPAISPELMSAIRLECGLERTQEEEKPS